MRGHRGPFSAALHVPLGRKLSHIFSPSCCFFLFICHTHWRFLSTWLFFPGCLWQPAGARCPPHLPGRSRAHHPASPGDGVDAGQPRREQGSSRGCTSGIPEHLRRSVCCLQLRMLSHQEPSPHVRNLSRGCSAQPETYPIRRSYELHLKKERKSCSSSHHFSICHLLHLPICDLGAVLTHLSPWLTKQRADGVCFCIVTLACMQSNWMRFEGNSNTTKLNNSIRAISTA